LQNIKKDFIKTPVSTFVIANRGSINVYYKNKISITICVVANVGRGGQVRGVSKSICETSPA
jgi:hypothetical protein